MKYFINVVMFVKKALLLPTLSPPKMSIATLTLAFLSFIVAISISGAKVFGFPKNFEFFVCG